jgi:HD-like signal output (HDOD) protein
MKQQAVAVEQKILQSVLDGVRFNAVKMPSLPEVAMRVRAAASNPNVTVDILAVEIIRDAALTARIIRVANSPLVRARAEIRSLPQAVLRLGIDYVRDLVTAFALENSFEPRSPVVKRVLREIWANSKETAALCSVLAQRSKKVPADQALLAGLMHSIGALPLLAAVDEQAGMQVDPNVLGTMIEEIHGDLGGTILRAWRFPEEIARVPEQYRDPCRPHEGPADLVDLVAVAHVMLKFAGASDDRMPLLVGMDAVKRLGLENDADLLANLVKSDEVSLNRGALGG